LIWSSEKLSKKIKGRKPLPEGIYPEAPALVGEVGKKIFLLDLTNWK